jgi:hypothetical protein
VVQSSLPILRQGSSSRTRSTFSQPSSAQASPPPGRIAENGAL